MLFTAAVLAGLLSVSSCWDLYDAAMQQSAQATRPRFVSYDEDVQIQAHGAQLVRERAHVEYRDDGLAVVQDDRLGPDPVLTRHLDPGPPELGPYGQARSAWLPPGSLPQFATIAHIRVASDETCENTGLAQADGSPAYHLVFHRADSAGAGLKELWVNPDTGEITRVIVAGMVRYLSTGNAHAADFDVRLSPVDGFNVISKVTWTQGDYQGDYTFENYSFPSSIAALDSVSVP